MEQVDEIKQKTDMVALVSEYVILKRAGRNYKGLCPFHGEKSPSFMVNPELQIYKCFGCGKGGDCFSFLQDIEGMNFSESLQHLAKKVGVVLTRYKPSEGEAKRERMIGINAMAAEAYHWLLTKHATGKVALDYLKQRGVTDEAIERFRLGYSPDDWHFLEGFLVKKKHYTVEELAAVGLLGKSERTQKYYDRFRQRIMFPLSNNRGQVVGFSGRVLPGADEKAGGKYVNTSETEIYHKSELLYGLDINRSDIKRENMAVVVEGEMDVIASWQAEVKNVVAIKGSALTERQVELLRRLCETVVLSLDGDLAGDAAARRGIEIAQKSGLFVKILNSKSEDLNPKHFKDAGEWAVADAAGWKKAVEQAIPIYDFYLQSAVERCGLSAQGKKQIGQELVPILAKIEDDILRAHYINLIAMTLGVREEDVRAQLGKIRPTASVNPTVGRGVVVGEKKTRREVIEEYLVALAVRHEKIGALFAVVDAWPFEEGFWKRVVEALRTVPDVAQLPVELRSRVEDLLMQEDRVTEVEKVWERAVLDLEELILREQLDQFKGQEDRLVDMAKITRRLSDLTRTR